MAVHRSYASGRSARPHDVAGDEGSGPILNGVPPTVPGTVFLNLAYGPESEELLFAYIVGLTALGLTPMLALEVADSGRRLDHIRFLLHQCEYSLHDVHRVGARRWNMILELGMAIGRESEMARDRRGKHRWFVLDSEYRRAIRALSDLNGTDVHEHHGSAHGVFGALLNIFSHPGRLLTVSRLENLFKKFLRRARLTQSNQQAKSPFERRVFERLIIEAQRLTKVK
jgi:hypothetical protein